MIPLITRILLSDSTGRNLENDGRFSTCLRIVLTDIAGRMDGGDERGERPVGTWRKRPADLIDPYIPLILSSSSVMSHHGAERDLLTQTNSAYSEGDDADYNATGYRRRGSSGNRWTMDLSNNRGVPDLRRQAEHVHSGR